MLTGVRFRGVGLGLLLALVLSAVLAGFGVGSRLLARPSAATVLMPDAGASLRAQHRLAELLMRAGGLSQRADPVELSSAELNAFLARHVESRRLPLRPLLVHAEEGRLDVAGRASVRQIGPEWLRALLPDALLELDLWVTVQGRLEVRPGEGEFVVERAAMGRQPVPPGWLWRLLDLDPREHLTWRMPRIVDRIEVKRDHLVIYTRHRGG